MATQISEIKIQLYLQNSIIPCSTFVTLLSLIINILRFLIDLTSFLEIFFVSLITEVGISFHVFGSKQIKIKIMLIFYS